QWRRFVDAQHDELRRLAAETAQLGAAIVAGVTVAHAANVYNCAALLLGGRIHGFVPKEKLPTYNVFYEGRTFSPGRPGWSAGGERDQPLGDWFFQLDFGAVAIEVCEDIWSPDGPMRRRCFAGAEVVVNISASPFRVGVQDTRREMICTRSADNQATVL